MAEARLYTTARVSSDKLDRLQNKSSLKPENSEKAVTKRVVSRDSDMAIHMATVGFVGLLGLAIGRYSHQI